MQKTFTHRAYRGLYDCVCARLTLTVLGKHGVSIVTGLTGLTVSSGSVEKAPQALAGDDVTVSRLAYVHITVTITAHTGAIDCPWVTIETTRTPKGAERGVTRAAKADRVSLVVVTFHSCFLCVLPGNGHTPPFLTPPARRWD